MDMGAFINTENFLNDELKPKIKQAKELDPNVKKMTCSKTLGKHENFTNTFTVSTLERG